MTDDRSLERAARSFIEAGPTQAPDSAVAAALQRIETTTQERDLRLPWRPTSMLYRMAFATLGAAAAISAIAVGASLIRTPDNAVAACPATRNEADAIDTFVAGLTAAERRWGITGGTPERVAQGLVAAFAYDRATDDRTLIAIDPLSGQRCVLIRHVSGPVQSPGGTQLDWSPAGDALAIGLAGDEGPEGQGPGRAADLDARPAPSSLGRRRHSLPRLVTRRSDHRSLERRIRRRASPGRRVRGPHDRGAPCWCCS